MMSAGLIGAPGLGYAKDRFAGEALQSNPVVFQQYKADKPSRFLPFLFDEATGLDGKKLGDVQKKLEASRSPSSDPNAAPAQLSAEEKAVIDASIAGDRKTLVADSAIPAAMAVIYLLLLLYFATIGGYKPVHIEASSNEPQAAPAVG